jgi:hypothetical protein
LSLGSAASPPFLSIGQSFMEFVSDITRERIRYRANGYGPVLSGAAATYVHQDRQTLRRERSITHAAGIPAVISALADSSATRTRDTPDKPDPTRRALRWWPWAR